MLEQNLRKIVKFASKLNANDRARLVKQDDGLYSLSVYAYTDRFELRPCSGDSRNGIHQVSANLLIRETKSGWLKIEKATVSGSIPHGAQTNWNGWREIDIPCKTWNDVKDAFNSNSPLSQCELYVTCDINSILSKASESNITIGYAYESVYDNANVRKLKEVA